MTIVNNHNFDFREDILQVLPEIPNSITSKTVEIHSLSWSKYGWCKSQVLQQWKAATILLCKSLEWAGGGLEHCAMMKSQIHFNDRLHSSDSVKENEKNMW